MQTPRQAMLQWTCSLDQSPREEAIVEFLLQDRATPVHGTYSDGLFHSRWATYATSRVRAWRALDSGPQEPNAGTKRAERDEASLALLRRLNRLFARSSQGAPSDQSGSAPRSHSNQISS